MQRLARWLNKSVNPQAAKPWFLENDTAEEGASPAPVTVHTHHLFVDFDGVLHPYSRGDLCCAPVLSQILSSFEHWGVVISSNWRRTMGIEDMQAMLPSDLASRIIGAIPDLSGAPAGQMPGLRYHEIRSWLVSNPALGFLILDDEPELFGPVPPPELLVIDRTTGLQERDIPAIQELMALQ